MYNPLKITSLGMLFLTPMAFGAGFQLNELSAAAMGRANAGEPAMSDTAAAIARNPAAASAFEKTSLSVVLHIIDPDVDVEGNISTPSPLLKPNADAEDIAPKASVPGLYYVNPLNSQWAIGMAINSHFGLSTDYGMNYAGSEFADKTSIKTYYITPSVAFKPIDTVALGLGLSYIYGEGEIRNSSTPTIQTLTTLAPPNATLANNTILLDLEGDGDTFGFQLGLTWDVAKGHRFGLRYQSAVDLDFEGDMDLFVSTTSNPLLPAPGATLPFTGKLTLNLPEVYEIGYAGNITSTIKILAGIQHNGWSSFESLTVDIDQTGSKQMLKDEDWKDSLRYSLGAEFVTDSLATLRIGYGIDESPVRAEKRTLTIPDAKRQWLTFGTNLNFNQAGSIDLAVMLLSGDKVTVNETSKLSTQFKGELSTVDALIYSVGYNYAF